MAQSSGKINLKGKFPNRQKLAEFLEDFMLSDIQKIQRRKKRTKFLAGSAQYVVTLYFEVSAQSHIDSAFSQSPLHRWRKSFNITDD